MANDSVGTDLRDIRYLGYPYRLAGTGTPNTVTPAADGGALAAASVDPHLRDLILQVLFTNPGERVNLPEFGVGVRRLVFAPNNDALRTSTQFLISTNLRQWLGDRIEVEQVTVTSEPGYEETVTIDIVYTVLRTRSRQRLQVEV